MSDGHLTVKDKLAIACFSLLLIAFILTAGTLITIAAFFRVVSVPAVAMLASIVAVLAVWLLWGR